MKMSLGLSRPIQENDVLGSMADFITRKAKVVFGRCAVHVL